MLLKDNKPAWSPWIWHICSENNTIISKGERYKENMQTPEFKAIVFPFFPSSFYLSESILFAIQIKQINRILTKNFKSSPTHQITHTCTKKRKKFTRKKHLSLVWTDHKPLGVFRICVYMHIYIYIYVKYKCIYTHKHTWVIRVTYTISSRIILLLLRSV